MTEQQWKWAYTVIGIILSKRFRKGEQEIMIRILRHTIGSRRIWYNCTRGEFVQGIRRYDYQEPSLTIGETRFQYLMTGLVKDSCVFRIRKSKQSMGYALNLYQLRDSLKLYYKNKPDNWTMLLSSLFEVFTSELKRCNIDTTQVFYGDSMASIKEITDELNANGGITDKTRRKIERVKVKKRPILWNPKRFLDQLEIACEQYDLIFARELDEEGPKDRNFAKLILRDLERDGNSVEEFIRGITEDWFMVYSYLRKKKRKFTVSHLGFHMTVLYFNRQHIYEYLFKEGVRNEWEEIWFEPIAVSLERET